MRPIDELDDAQRAAYEERRARLLPAAAAAASRLGSTVTMADVAREAGLGMSSVYRTFASKEDLLEALLAERKARWLEIWQRADARPDAGPALIDAIWEFVELEHHDIGLAEAVRDLAFRRRELVRETQTVGERVLRRAQEQGAVRADVDYGDVLRIFLMLTVVHDEREWRRGMALYLDGLRPGVPGTQMARVDAP